MRSLAFLFLSFSVLLCVPAFAGNVPACVKRADAKAKPFLRVPAGKKTSKKKSKKKTAKVKDESIKVARYTPVNWTGKKESGWMEVKDMAGRTYWVRRNDLSFSMKCLSVQVQKSRLRTGPGTNFEQAPVAQKGDTFLDLGGEDGWTRVENSKGEQAWINLDHTWRPASRKRMVFEPEHP
jgi:hypothetical protein